MWGDELWKVENEEKRELGGVLIKIKTIDFKFSALVWVRKKNNI